MKTRSFALCILFPMMGTTSSLLSAGEPGKAPVQIAKAAATKEVTPQEAAKLLASTKPLVLDVRTPDEFAEGHIQGALNISSNDPDFDKKVGAMDKTRSVILHCAAGGRSARVLPKLEALHFTQIYHMNGGFNAWADAGQPVAK